MDDANERVASLLADSLAAHTRARAARYRKRREDAERELRDARDLRLAAHQLDPEHAAPAWKTETPTHSLMMAFYQQQLGEAV
jgi:hypothetical protein